jgi:hypothetical protein
VADDNAEWVAAMAERPSNRLSQIGTKLRLNPKSVYRVSRVGGGYKSVPGREPWNFTRIADRFDPPPE